MLEIINELSTKLETYTGVKGILGYICIAAAIMIGHAMINSSSNKKVSDVESVEDERDPPRNFTVKQLAYFDGKKDKNDEDKPVYLALNTTVFDVSEGRNFYGPDGPYEIFAGHECGVALAKMSFEAKHLDNFEGVQDLNFGEKAELDNWIEKFTHYRNYPVMGHVVPDEKMPSSDRILSTEDLAQHNGNQEKPENYGTAPIYLALGSKVFDVSFGGVTMYGPNCAYEKFAGRDASRALAKMSFDPADLENTDVSDCTEKQRKTLEDWIKTFEERKLYPIIGKLKK